MTYKQVFIINDDLKMGKGKIAVQVAHGEVYYMIEALKRFAPYNNAFQYNYIKWIKEEDELMKKVVLKATEKQMNDIMEKLMEEEIMAFPVYDRGLTQVLPNSFTCICVEPLTDERCNELFEHLKLL